ncbi:hypothetical protein [Amycolatopsis sp. cg9]|uniref:hypothetical protein n=1 Tax=Amycolatopsis sp. cg9 TaxID=3238801 RepID=UPI00352625C7
MAGQSAGFDENPNAIDEHAKQVETTFGVLKEAVELSKNDSIGSDAFGLIGRLCFLDLWCDNVASGAREALDSAVKGADYHVQAVRTWARARRVDEESASALVNRASEVRGG